MRKWRLLDILLVFRLDLGQISLNLLKNARASPQLGFLATGIAFYDISTQSCADIKILRFLDKKMTYVSRLSIFGFFCAFPFSPFLFFLLQ